jgi:hypothetical protein
MKNCESFLSKNSFENFDLLKSNNSTNSNNNIKKENKNSISNDSKKTEIEKKNREEIFKLMNSKSKNKQKIIKKRKFKTYNNYKIISCFDCQKTMSISIELYEKLMKKNLKIYCKNCLDNHSKYGNLCYNDKHYTSYKSGTLKITCEDCRNVFKCPIALARKRIKCYECHKKSLQNENEFNNKKNNLTNIENNKIEISKNSEENNNNNININNKDLFFSEENSQENIINLTKKEEEISNFLDNN